MDGVDERVHHGRQARPDDHGSVAAGSEKILGDGLDPRVGLGLAGVGAAAGDCGMQRASDLGQIRGARAQAMVRHHAGAAQRRFGNVEPAHLGAWRPPLGPLTLRREPGGPAAEEVGVERDDDFGFGQIELRLERAAEGKPRAFVGLVHRHGRVRIPARLGEGGADALVQRAEQRRAGRLDEEGELAATVALLALEVGAERAAELIPALARAVVLDFPGAAVVVERQHRCLIERRGRSLVDRMIGVALDLGRAGLPTRSPARPSHSRHG